MADAINRCSAEETAACCCVDVGTIIDNKNCTASYQHVFADKVQAQAMLINSVQKHNLSLQSLVKSINNLLMLMVVFNLPLILHFRVKQKI